MDEKEQEKKSNSPLIFMTGATSGLGLVAACELAAEGATLIATARNPNRGDRLIQTYQKKYPQGKGTIEIVICDLASFDSIISACNQVKEKFSHLDILINNAGLWNFSYRETDNHIEETLQVNAIAPLLLNHLLLELLQKADAPKSIFTASGLHQGEINFGNLEYKRGFSGFLAYRQSKLAVILMTRWLSRHLEKAGVGVYCLHPGLVSTDLGRKSGWFAHLFFKVFGISAKKGARTLIFLAKTEKDKLVSGEYYFKKRVRKITAQSYDLEVAQKLADRFKDYLKGYLDSGSLL